MHGIVISPDLNKMEDYLKSLGADEVVTEETSSSHHMASLLEVYLGTGVQYLLVTALISICV